MTIDISYNAHGANLVLYAIILDKSLSVYSPLNGDFVTFESVELGTIFLSELVLNSYVSSIDSSNFITGSYIIRIYQVNNSSPDIAVDELLHVSEFNWDAQLQREVDSLDSNYYLPELLSYGVDQVYIIKVIQSENNSGNIFQVNDMHQPIIRLKRGEIYRLDQSNISNSDTGYSGEDHPLRISTTPDGHHSGGVLYSDGLIYSETVGHIGSYTIFKVPSDAPSKLYYHCHNHPNMGGVIEIIGGNINDFGNNTIEVVTKRGSSASGEVNIITR